METIKENVIDKIYKILQQDMICILPDENTIKKNIKLKIFFLI